MPMYVCKYVCVCLVVKGAFVCVCVSIFCEVDFVYQYAYTILIIFEHINRSVYNMSALSNFSI